MIGASQIGDPQIGSRAAAPAGLGTAGAAQRACMMHFFVGPWSILPGGDADSTVDDNERLHILRLWCDIAPLAGATLTLYRRRTLTVVNRRSHDLTVVNRRSRDLDAVNRRIRDMSVVI